MCGRYGYSRTLEEELALRYNLSKMQQKLLEENINVTPGQFAPVITKNGIVMMKFGLVPAYDLKKLFINARSEGKLNETDDPEYAGDLGIIKSPVFSKPLKNNRVIIPAKFFFEGPKNEKLSTPFLVFRRDCAWMSLAGISNTVVDEKTGELIETFAILTTTPNDVLQWIGHHRSPVILSPDEEQEWLHSTGEKTYLAMLNRNENGIMNAWQITDKMKKPGTQDFTLTPVGKPFVETDVDETIKKLLNR